MQTLDARSVGARVEFDRAGGSRRPGYRVPSKRHGIAEAGVDRSLGRHPSACVASTCRLADGMPRLAKYDEGQILGAAAKLVAANGPGAATMTAIGAAIGAPNGSLYHRFRSRDELLGRLWLSKARVFQDSWAAALEEPDARQAGLEAALSMPRVVREDLEGARIMLLHRREDFLSDGWPPEMKAEAERLGRQVKETMSEMTRRLFGRDTTAGRRTTAFATIDIPFSAVRRFVGEGGAPPAQIDTLIAHAYHAVIDGTLSESDG